MTLDRFGRKTTLGALGWEHDPDPQVLEALLAEMEAAFEAALMHYPESGPITRPIVAMRKLVAELARRQLPNEPPVEEPQ